MNISSYIRTAKSVITANSPVLLLGTTIAGVVTTGVLSAKAGWNARGICDEEQARRYSEYGDVPALTPQEIAQLTWATFSVPTIAGAGTIAAAVGTHTIHTKRANAMAALYAVTSNKLDDMGDRAEELLGPKKAQQLRDDVAQKQVDRDPLKDDSEVILLNEGTELCYDEWSGRYFLSSMPKLESAFNDLNRLIVDTDEASLNDLYECMGLSTIPIGENYGWSGVKVDAKFGAVKAKDGRPAISVSFQKAPTRV